MHCFYLIFLFFFFAQFHPEIVSNQNPRNKLVMLDHAEFLPLSKINISPPVICPFIDLSYKDFGKALFCGINAVHLC